MAVTGHKAEKISKFDQGFVACISGIITVMNESPDTLHPGALLTWEVSDKYPDPARYSRSQGSIPFQESRT